MITFLWSSVPYLTDIFTYISLVFNHKQQVLLLVDNQKKRLYSNTSSTNNKEKYAFTFQIKNGFKIFQLELTIMHCYVCLIVCILYI